MSAALETLYESARLPVPAALAGWHEKVSAWCDAYATRSPRAHVVEIVLGPAVFVFDHTFERVVLAYAVSVPQLLQRDTSRIRGFPNVNLSVRKALGSGAFIADRGHFLGHASGGELDINLFPHRRTLNRGWSSEGKRFRQMEAFVAKHSGCFFYHLALYDDASWIPAKLEYGILGEGGKWRVEQFNNKLKVRKVRHTRQ